MCNICCIGLATTVCIHPAGSERTSKLLGTTTQSTPRPNALHKKPFDEIGRAAYAEIFYRFRMIFAPLEKAGLTRPMHAQEIFLRTPLDRFFLQALELCVHVPWPNLSAKEPHEDMRAWWWAVRKETQREW